MDASSINTLNNKSEKIIKFSSFFRLLRRYALLNKEILMSKSG